jgi:hypothetical protein
VTFEQPANRCIVQTAVRHALLGKDNPVTDRIDDIADDDTDPEELTAEELLEQAQINAQALFLGTAEALGPDSRLLDAWRTSLAATFIRGWDTDEEWEPADILYALATNYQAFGAAVVEARFEDVPPSVTIANLPNVHLADALGIAPDRMHHLFRIGEDLAARLGGSLTWTAGPDDTIRLEAESA